MKLLVTLAVLSLASAQLHAQDVGLGSPPGRLIDVGGRKIHLNCTGAGSPTVVLVGGAESFAVDWSLVQPQMARTQRVCSYDRAGLGWSDPRSDVETPARVVADLSKALTAAGEKPPYLMVGASAGTVSVRIYQLDHPEEIVGLVLIDPQTEDRTFTSFQGRSVLIGSLTAEQLLTTLPATGSVETQLRAPARGDPFDRLPLALFAERLGLDQRLLESMPDAVPMAVVRETAEGQRTALARLLERRNREDNPIRGVPVIVLTGSQDMSPTIAENHLGLSRLSRNSRHTIIPSGPLIHLSAPSSVIRAIQDVAAAITQGRPL